MLRENRVTRIEMLAQYYAKMEDELLSFPQALSLLLGLIDGVNYIDDGIHSRTYLLSVLIVASFNT
jgi:hypothetical protein